MTQVRKRKSVCVNFATDKRHQMSEPFLVEESTPFRLPATLEKLADTLGKCAVHHDYVMALVIVVMTEAGFSLATLKSADNDQGCSKKPLAIPDDWISESTGNYSVEFYLAQVPDRGCKILAIPSGDTLVINLVLTNGDKRVFSKAVQTVKYVNIYSSDLSGRYMNLKEFSFGFKNALSTPARGEILSSAGITNPSLRGLPAEMKLRILGMLDVHSLAKMAQVSKEFLELSEEPTFWRRLLLRTVPYDLILYNSVDNYKILCKKNLLHYAESTNRRLQAVCIAAVRGAPMPGAAMHGAAMRG